MDPINGNVVTFNNDSFGFFKKGKSVVAKNGRTVKKKTSIRVTPKSKTSFLVNIVNEANSDASAVNSSASVAKSRASVVNRGASAISTTSSSQSSSRPPSTSVATNLPSQKQLLNQKITQTRAVFNENQRKKDRNTMNQIKSDTTAEAANQLWRIRYADDIKEAERIIDAEKMNAILDIDTKFKPSEETERKKQQVVANATAKKEKLHPAGKADRGFITEILWKDPQKTIEKEFAKQEEKQEKNQRIKKTDELGRKAAEFNRIEAERKTTEAAVQAAAAKAAEAAVIRAQEAATAAATTHLKAIGMNANRAASARKTADTELANAKAAVARTKAAAEAAAKAAEEANRKVAERLQRAQETAAKAAVTAAVAPPVTGAAAATAARQGGTRRSYRKHSRKHKRSHRSRKHSRKHSRSYRSQKHSQKRSRKNH